MRLEKNLKGDGCHFNFYLEEKVSNLLLSNFMIQGGSDHREPLISTEEVRVILEITQTHSSFSNKSKGKL